VDVPVAADAAEIATAVPEAVTVVDRVAAAAGIAAEEDRLGN
jgi:hypothetical protein